MRSGVPPLGGAPLRHATNKFNRKASRGYAHSEGLADPLGCDAAKSVMVEGYHLPESWIGVTGLAIIAIGGLVTAWITAHGARKSAMELKNDVSAVKEQVQNSHPTNLRDDVDAVRCGIEGTKDAVRMVAEQLREIRRYQVDHGHDISGLRDEIGSVRGEIRKERDDRVDLEHRIAGFIKREHPGSPPL